MKKAHIVIAVVIIAAILGVGLWYVINNQKSSSNLSYTNRLGMNGSSNPRAIKICKEEEVCDDEESRKCRFDNYAPYTPRIRECKDILMNCYKKSGLSDCAAKALYQYDAVMQAYYHEITLVSPSEAFHTPEGAMKAYNNYMQNCPELKIKADCFVA